MPLRCTPPLSPPPLLPLAACQPRTAPLAPPSEWNDPARLTVDALLVGSIIGIVVSRIGNVRQGLYISAAIGGAVLVLWIAATLLIAAARRV